RMWNPRSPQSQGPGGRSCSVHIVAGIPSQKLSPIERASFSVGHLWRLRIRVRVARAALVGFLMAFFLPGLGTPLVRAQNVGHRDFSYGKTGDAKLTGERPESKLWWNDGSWWGSLFDPLTLAYHIYRLDAATQTWVDTGTALDSRTWSKADALWDSSAGKLYVVS